MWRKGDAVAVSRARAVLWRALPVAALLAGTAGTLSARAQSFSDALGLAYQNNPALEGDRAGQRANDELVPQARSAELPQVSGSGNIGREWSVIGNQPHDYRAVTQPGQGGFTINQAIYHGGSIEAGVDQAENQVKAGRATLLNTEQTVLLAAATVYLDVMRDQAVVDLNVSNEQVLTRQLEATRDRFRVGELTRTDVSQSETRLASARADRVSAEGQLAASRATYARVMGEMPGTLRQPPMPTTLPGTMDDAIARAETEAPAVVAAKYNLEAAVNGVDIATGALLPSLDAQATYSRYWDQATTGVNGQYDIGVVGAQITIPLYQGSGPTAKIRGAKQTRIQRRNQMDEAIREAREGAIQAWMALSTARGAIAAYEVQVQSALVALDGVKQEQTVGSRTILDVLNAQQELLNARVQLVRAHHDEQVAAYKVLAAVGEMTAVKLGLDVPVYDVKAHYNEVRDKLWGVSEK